jgi:hypothetical protein
MYFETTMHRTRAVESAAQAARIIKERDELHDFDALIWNANDRRLAVVADNHCNNSWLEVAVIDLNRGVQIESITAGWIETADELQRYFEECETTDFKMCSSVTLPLDNEGGDTRASFECGCCGTGFESTYREQRRFDQDNGYGICPSCRKYYGG